MRAAAFSHVEKLVIYFLSSSLSEKLVLASREERKVDALRESEF